MQTIPLDSLEFVRHCEHQTDSQLQVLQDQLQSKMVKIQIQLDSQLINSKNDWEHRAKTSLRYTVWRLQVVQRVLQQRKRTQYQQLQQSYEHRFLLKAKELLDEDTYSVISDAALEDNAIRTNGDNYHRPR